MRPILVGVAWALLALALVRVPTPDPACDATLIPQLDRVLQAASAGRLFQAAPGETCALPAYDLGMFAWPSAVVVGLRAWVAPAWQPDLRLWFHLQFGLYAVAVAIVCLPAVPRRLALGATAFLVGHVLAAGADPLGGLFAAHYYGYWAPPLACVVALVWLLTIARGDRAVGGVTVAAGLFVGLLGTWRVDAALIPALGALGFLGWCALTRSGRRAAVGCVVFVLLTRVPDLALRGAMAWHQAATGVPHFQDGGVRGHMLFHNLYLSYATVSLEGPRAEWDDTIGWLHATEYAPRLTTAQSRGRLSPDHDRALLELYATTAAERPLLWLAALGSRAVELADLCWPSLVLAAGTLLFWRMMTGVSWARGPLVVQCAPKRGPAPAWAAAGLLVAAALPPLFYSALPWYARAFQVTARALPWLLLLAGAGTRAVVPPPAFPPRFGPVLGGVARVLVPALALALVAAEARRLAYVQGLAQLDRAAWCRRWGEDPRRLRVNLPDAPPARLAELARELVQTHGAVKGGGAIDRRGATAPARLVHAARVGLHVVLWLEATAGWPGKGAMRDQGGWVDLELDGPRPGAYRMRLPRFERGAVFPVLLPVDPADEAPVTARVSLRAWSLTNRAEPVGVVTGLTRALSW